MSCNKDATIRALPKDVVDRIAAGEVVARPSSALKELLENSLDAGATKISITVDKSSAKMLNFSISDDGHGIAAVDLPLAATRFATSKLNTVADFQTLASFGFRGEALASISMVSHLTITSRTTESPLAHECSYEDGKPRGPPTRCARTPGTTVKVNDLFYNVPHRKKALRDEYPKMLQVVQPFAVHVASQGVGIIVEQKGGKKSTIDLNTSNLSKVKAILPSESETRDQLLTEQQQAATKQVIANVYGSYLEPHLLYFNTQIKGDADQDMSYTCQGFLTAPSLSSTQQTLQLKHAAVLFFVNDRHVECPSLKRHLEEVYSTVTAWKRPPMIYLSIQVPPPHVDVNVHPSKSLVALLYMQDIVADICSKIQTVLADQGGTFGEKQQSKISFVANPYLKKNKDGEQTTPDNEEGTKKRKGKKDSAHSAKSQRRSSASNSAPISMSQLVRTHNATPVGALEPFLVRQVKTTETPSTLASTPSASHQSTESPLEAATPSSSQRPFIHRPPCPFAVAAITPATPSDDMDQPGAFARLAKQCTCRKEDMQQQMSTQSMVLLPPQTRMVRPKPVVPTVCPLTSVKMLRRRVKKRLDQELHQKLRKAYFVGVVSEHRSVVQCHEELCLLQHTHMAEALFYQLALAHFGENRVATLGSPIQVQILIEQLLQMEEDFQGHDVGLPPPGPPEDDGGDGVFYQVHATNAGLAKQATACLWEKADMLEEYFGIRFKKHESNAELLLTGLPVLLDGHAPQPHGLPLFLLRLATEVDWAEERPCFDAVCREIGSFYAQLPSCDGLEGEGGAELKAMVQHTMFPALISLLMPSTKLQEDLMTLTNLPNLYKVFERC